MKYEIPLIIVSVANQREHWGAKARRAKAHRQAAALITPACIRPPCTITLTRIAPRKLDDDNLASAFKACRDGIADKIGINDNDPRVQWR